MKKICICLLLSSCFLTGCNSNAKLDFDILETLLLSAQSEGIDLDSIPEFVEIDNYILPKMDSVVMANMKYRLGIDGKSLFEEVLIRVPVFIDDPSNLDYAIQDVPYSEDEKLAFYMILKPLEGKTEEAKIQMEEFFLTLTNYNSDVEKIVEAEVDGYLIYIMSDNSEQILNLIKSAKPKLFESYQTLDKENFEITYGVDQEYVEELFVKVPYMPQNEATIIIVKAVSGKSTTIKNILDKYLDDLEGSINYVEQKELISNHLYKRIGNYLIYIISTDNEKIYSLIETSKIED